MGGKVTLVPHQVLKDKPGVLLVSLELLAGQAVAAARMLELRICNIRTSV